MIKLVFIIKLNYDIYGIYILVLFVNKHMQEQIWHMGTLLVQNYLLSTNFFHSQDLMIVSLIVHFFILLQDARKRLSV